MLSLKTLHFIVFRTEFLCISHLCSLCFGLYAALKLMNECIFFKHLLQIPISCCLTLTVVNTNILFTSVIVGPCNVARLKILTSVSAENTASESDKGNILRWFKLTATMRSSGLVDPGWEHGMAQDERKKKVKCNYCGKIVSGGIYRLKQHLARVSGEVTYCDKAPEDVYMNMKANMEGSRSNKKPRHSEDIGQAYLNFQSNDDEEEVHVGYRSKGKQLMGDRNLAMKLTPLRSLGYVDPGWEHGVAQDEKKKKVKCIYCEKIVSGGINRFKQHLARIPGEVAPCKHAPEEVFLKIKENMKWHRTGRRQRQPDSKDMSPFDLQSDNEDQDDDQMEAALHHINKERLIDGDRRLGQNLRNTFKALPPSTGSEPLFKRSRLDSLFLTAPKSLTPHSYKQVRVRTMSNKISRKEVISGICKFFYHAGVPLQATNSLYFHKMLELVGQYGQGLVAPPSQLISGRFLQEEIATIKTYLADYKASWAITGCSIMADSWRDTEGRILINFLASGPNGVYFVSSVDATEIVEDASNLFKLLDKVVEEMGEENVVQVFGFLCFSCSSPSQTVIRQLLTLLCF